MSNKTSSGWDGIPNIALKRLPKICIRNYTVIFNNCSNNAYFPEVWKLAKLIILIKKISEAISIDNIRPISMLPPISKIFERIINRIITYFSTVKKPVIPPQQFGFRKSHATTHAIHKLVSDLYWHMSKGDMIGAVLIDLKKAFDSVWHNGLIYKLAKIETPIHLLKLIYNMILNRSFKVSLNGIVSNQFWISKGLQQGTVNSPALFNIFTADILRLFDLNNNKNIYGIAFTDDVIAYIANRKMAMIEKNLQIIYNKISDYYKNWKLQVNPKKCETILFRDVLEGKDLYTRKNWRKFQIKDTSNDIVIPHKRIVKYLGVHLDDRLKFNDHMKIQLNKAKDTFNQLHRLSYSKHLNDRAKIISWLSLIRPIVTYACPIWFNISSSYMEKLRLFERKVIRASLFLYRSKEHQFMKKVSNFVLLREAKIPRIDSFIIKLIRDHIKNSIKNQENNLIYGPYFEKTLFHMNNMRSGFIPPETFLYLDQNGYIVDEDMVPYFYHVPRHNSNKRILFKPERKNNLSLVYSTATTEFDKRILDKFHYYKK